MKRTLLRATLGLSMALFAAAGAQADHPHASRAGTLSCGGNYAVNSAGIRTQGTFWTLRNRNNSTEITVTALRIYDARGTLVYDSSVSGLPASANQVVGPGNAVLGPHQTALFSTDALLATNALAPLPSTRRPIEFDVDWTAARRALPLTGAVTRVTRSGVSGEELSRAGYACHDTLRHRPH